MRGTCPFPRPTPAPAAPPAVPPSGYAPAPAKARTPDPTTAACAARVKELFAQYTKDGTAANEAAAKVSRTARNGMHGVRLGRSCR